MTNHLLEYLVILIDASRSMLRKDFPPFRFALVLDGLPKFLKEKEKNTQEGVFAVIKYDSQADLILNFTEYNEKIVKKLVTQLKETTFPNNLSPPTNVPLQQALSIAIDLLSQKIRTLGNQLYRIFIITDQFSLNLDDQLLSILKNIQGLSIVIDITLITKTQNENIVNLKKITNMTKGRFQQIVDHKTFLTQIKNMALNEPINNFSPDYSILQQKNDSQYLNQVALSLLPLRFESLDQYKQNRCQICFGFKDFTLQLPLNKTGRKCPHCGIIMHLHCAGLWAQKSNEGKNLFRCPHCYTLLVVPLPILKNLSQKDNREKDSQNSQEQTPKNKTQMHIINSNELTGDDFCYYCYSYFLSKELPLVQQNNNPAVNPKNSEQKSYTCSKCHATYHQTCLEEMYNLTKTCQNCENLIT